MRTRRTAAAACSLLALSLLGACGEDDSSGPDADGSPSATTSESPSGSPSESASEVPSASPSEGPPPEGTTKLTIRGLSVGAWPAIAYAAADDPADPAGDWALVQAGGATRLPVTGIQSLATSGDGAVLLVNDGDDDTAVVVVDGSGEEVRREKSHGYRLARTADGSVVAWLRDDLTTTVLADDGTTLSLPEVPRAAEIGALAGGENCPDLTPDGYGCTAYLNGEEAGEVYLADSHGMAGPLGGALIRIADVLDHDLELGLISVDDLGSCSAVIGVKRKPLWETCDHTLTSFSPDGARVLGTDAYLDGFGQRSVVFLDADGAVLHQFLSMGRGATVLQTAWEDSDHVLAVLYERGRWAVARLGVDGSAELAVAPVEGADLDRPFVLEQN
jgi:hypothetical protein